ncbi:MAG: nucleotidyltransferase domain-containing protein [Oscillospiraceae bacterium]|nr:nucleotidyltransferase domain-containing protein [Oscillospiraceae bacterium]
MILSRQEVESAIRTLLKKYNADHAILFGSYARGEETEDSDIDVIIVGGEKFHGTDVFASAEDLFEMTNKDVDVYEISEVNKGTEFYNNIMCEGVRIA